jgi:predicted nucleotidyltransferase
MKIGIYENRYIVGIMRTRWTKRLNHMADESHLSILGQGVEQGHAVLAEAVAAYTQVLGERLVAAYALGSLAHGGFSPFVSDVDLALILTDPLRPTDSVRVAAVAWGLKAKGSALHDRLSVFWGTPLSLAGRVSGGRFPLLDRLDLIEHGRLLQGEDARGGLVPPRRDELLMAGAHFALEYLAGLDVEPPLGSLHRARGSRQLIKKLVLFPFRFLFTAGEGAVEEILRPELLLARGIRRLTKLVLFPVRFLFTADTGRVGTNDDAVDHYLASDTPPGATLVAAALAWRTVPPENDEAVLSLLEAGMVPLYLHYIDNQRAHLAALGRHDLAEAFGQWRRRLLQ